MATPVAKPKQSILADHFVSVALVAAILIFGSAYFFYFKGELSRLRAGGEFDVSRVTNELTARKEELSKLKSAVAALNSVSMEDREKIDRFLPKGPEEPSILSALSLILRDSGLTLLSIDATPTGAGLGKFPKGMKAVEVTMGIGGGNYARLKIFLEMVESSLRLFDIQSLAYAPGSSAYSVRLRAYYLEQ